MRHFALRNELLEGGFPVERLLFCRELAEARVKVRRLRIHEWLPQPVLTWNSEKKVISNRKIRIQSMIEPGTLE